MTSLAPNGYLSSVGYFDGAGRDEPTHDPRRDGGSCPVCGGELKDTKVLCRSIMPVDGARSYFITYHANCDKTVVDELEDEIVGEIFAWDDMRKSGPQ